MKKLFLLGCSVFVLIACNNSNTKTPEAITEEEVMHEIEEAIGGEKDAHGCLVAAGETWSELLATCVQVFNVAQRLNPVAVDSDEATFSAFVLMSDDQEKAELFIPHAITTTILDKVEDGIYEGSNYTYKAAENALYLDDIKQYAAEE